MQLCIQHQHILSSSRKEEGLSHSTSDTDPMDPSGNSIRGRGRENLTNLVMEISDIYKTIYVGDLGYLKIFSQTPGCIIRQSKVIF
jgi:hypothetical protein